jgi:hypothetical protein
MLHDAKCFKRAHFAFTREKETETERECEGKDVI